MPIYTLEGPDGRKYRIEGPEGATADQLAAVISGGGQQPKDPYAATAEKQSTAQNLLAGVGGGMTSLYLGGKQALGLDKPGEVEDHRRAMAGLNKTTAGSIGDFTGQAALALPAAFIPGANTMLGAAALGGTMGALQPTGENDSRGLNMVLGAGGGMAGKYLGDKAIKLMRGRVQQAQTIQTTPGVATSENTVTGGATATGKGGGYNFGYVGDDASAGVGSPTQAIMRRGKELGFRNTPGQASGSKALQQLEAKLESQPMTSGPFNDIKAGNQTVLNRIAANAIGETSDTLDAATLAQARDRIGGIYRMVADQTPRQINPDEFLTKLASIENDFEGMIPGGIANHPLAKRLLNFAGDGQATGEQLQSIASKLGKVAHNNMTSRNGDRDLGMALFQVKDIADDLLASGLNGKTAEAFNQARGQYRNLMMITQRNGVINPTTGNISGNALGGLLQQKDRPGFLFGGNQSPLYDAARFAQAFRPIVGDSGTATRMTLSNPVDVITSSPFSILSHIYASRPVTNTIIGARGGIAPDAGRSLAPFLPPATEALGGLFGARLSN